MVLLYYPPFRANDDDEMMELATIALRAYVEDLVQYPEPTLRRAWREVRRAHKVERWPTIQTILEACSEGRPAIAGGSGRYRPATEIEREYQMRAYGQVRMDNVTDRDASYHRRQAEDKEAGRLKGPMQLNPFASKRMMH